MERQRINDPLSGTMVKLRIETPTFDAVKEREASHRAHRPRKPAPIALDCHKCAPTMRDPITHKGIKWPFFGGSTALKKHIDRVHKQKSTAEATELLALVDERQTRLI